MPDVSVGHDAADAKLASISKSTVAAGPSLVSGYAIAQRRLVCTDLIYLKSAVLEKSQIIRPHTQSGTLSLWLCGTGSLGDFMLLGGPKALFWIRQARLDEGLP